MKSALRTLLLVILSPLVLGVACDPQGPGAIGQLDVSPEASFEAGRTLEIRLLPDDGTPFDVATTDLSVEYPHRQASWNVSEIEFPYQYEIGGGLGSSEYEHWRVIAWIAGSEEVDRPEPGEWYGARDFSIEDCGGLVSGYCGVMPDINVEIALVRDSESPRRAESALEPGEYIEESFGDYTMRCSEGSDDSARSVGTYVVTVRSDDGSTPGQQVTETTGVRDGTIQDCWMTDLDGDGNGEIVLFSKSAGSGGYANLHIYKFDGMDLRSVELATADPDLMNGFQGRDWYELDHGVLVHKFPLYLEDDANCCPEGGNRALEYDAVSNSWKKFGEEK